MITIPTLQNIDGLRVHSHACFVKRRQLNLHVFFVERSLVHSHSVSMCANILVDDDLGLVCVVGGHSQIVAHERSVPACSRGQTPRNIDSTTKDTEFFFDFYFLKKENCKKLQNNAKNVV